MKKNKTGREHVTGHFKARKGKLQMRAILHYEDGTTKELTRNTGYNDNTTNRKRTSAAYSELNTWLDELEAKVVAEIQAKEKRARLENDPLFLEKLQKWLESSGLDIRENTRYNYLRTYKRHYATYPLFQDVRLTEVTPEIFSQYFDDKRDEGLSGNTLFKHYSNFKKFFEQKNIRKKLTENPIDGIDPPEHKKVEKDKIFNPDQLKKILDAIKGDRLESAVTICSVYGLRRSEVAALLWDAVDFQNKSIMIKRTMQCVGGRDLLTEYTKTESSRRPLSLSPEMFDYLVQLKAQQEENKKIFGSAYDSTGYVCCHPDGRPLRVDDITSHFIDIVKGLGLKDLGFHTLRHTVATQLAMKNVAVAKTRAFMGHKDVATTLRYYTHIPPEASIECAGVMSETVFA